MNLQLSRIHFPITALGPGNRIGIWFQGCSIQCPGCISMDTWNFDIGFTTIGAVIESIREWLPLADGVTISGGEPFDQPKALRSLLTEIKALLPEGDVLVYSGYTFERLKPIVETMSGLIDALISGPFVIEDKQTLPLRGSDNQVLHRLTPLGVERYSWADDPESCPNKSLDLVYDNEDSVYIAGIPQRGDLDRLVAILGASGITAETTEDRRRKY